MPVKWLHYRHLMAFVFNFQDVGSGRGHLARFLAYNYGLDVTAVEAVGEHLSAAAKFDG